MGLNGQEKISIISSLYLTTDSPARGVGGGGMRGWGGGGRRERKPWFAAFAASCGVNTPDMANFKLPT